jgi:hypothetical protein
VFTNFGVAVVFLLLSAKTVQSIYNNLASHNTTESYCLVVVLVAIALYPITLLESPKDFW